MENIVRRLCQLWARNVNCWEIMSCFKLIYIYIVGLIRIKWTMIIWTHVEMVVKKIQL